MEYHCKFEHNIGRIQHIYIMIRIGILYIVCCLGTQNVEHNLPGFQGLKFCIQYMDRNPLKPILSSSNSYDGTNVIKLTWSGNQVEYYITPNCLECHQDVNYTRINTRRWYVSGIIHTIIGVLFDVKYRYKQM